MANDKPEIKVHLVAHDIDDHVIYSNNITINETFKVDTHINQNNGHIHSTNIDKKKTTYAETFSNLLNGSIGCGILGMGIAFRHGGLLYSSGLTLLIASVALYNQHILIELATKFEEEYGYPDSSISETIGRAFDIGPNFFKRFANFIRKSVSTFIFLGQMGTCSIYLIFVATSVQQIFDTYDWNASFQTVLGIEILLIWITSLPRQMKHLTYISTIANMTTFVAIFAIFYYSLKDLPPIIERDMLGKKLPLCFSTIIFSMEGISLILPIQQDMENRKKFNSPLGILNMTFIIIALLNTTTGFIGYWKFGDEVMDSLTFNLELKNNIIAHVVIITMLLGIFFTYPIQLYVPLHIILPTIKRWTSKLPYSDYHEYFLKSFLILITYIFAATIPYINLVTSLFGSVTGSFVGFIFCPIADLLTRQRNDLGFLCWKRIMAIASLFMGFIGFIVGSSTSILEIIDVLFKGAGKAVADSE